MAKLFSDWAFEKKSQQLETKKDPTLYLRLTLTQYPVVCQCLLLIKMFLVRSENLMKVLSSQSPVQCRVMSAMGSGGGDRTTSLRSLATVYLVIFTTMSSLKPIIHTFFTITKTLSLTATCISMLRSTTLLCVFHWCVMTYLLLLKESVICN